MQSFSTTEKWKRIRGKLEQIDGGLTKTVFGIDSGQSISRVGRTKNKLYPIKQQSRLVHVSVGQGGIWGVNAQGQILFSQPKKPWQTVPGALMQVDAGPAGVVYGVTKDHKIFCRDGILPALPVGTVWRRVPGRLKYVSCGSLGCWGVNRKNHVYFRIGVKASRPIGVKWIKVGTVQLKEIEAGPGGIAAGVRPDGTVMIRVGVTRDLPYGNAWKKLDTFNAPVKHVSISLDKIYIITQLRDVYSSLLKKSPDAKTPAGPTPPPGTKPPPEATSMFVFRFYMALSFTVLCRVVLCCVLLS